jgi:IS1 family transposase
LPHISKSARPSDIKNIPIPNETIQANYLFPSDNLFIGGHRVWMRKDRAANLFSFWWQNGRKFPYREMQGRDSGSWGIYDVCANGSIENKCRGQSPNQYVERNHKEAQCIFDWLVEINWLWLHSDSSSLFANENVDVLLSGIGGPLCSNGLLLHFCKLIPHYQALMLHFKRLPTRYMGTFAIDARLPYHRSELKYANCGQNTRKQDQLPLSIRTWVICMIIGLSFLPVMAYGWGLTMRWDCSFRLDWRGLSGWLLILLSVVCLISDMSVIGLGSPSDFWRFHWLLDKPNANSRCKNQVSHGGNTVPHKYVLTNLNYRGTVIAIRRSGMAPFLEKTKQVQIVSALAEGSGIRQIERMTGVHRDTIMRLGVRVGKGCANFLDQKMRNLSCDHLQFDELWGFIGKKQKHVQPDDSPDCGDVWTFCAIDSDTKLVPSFKVGKRNSETANAFVSDVASRLINRVQVSTDGMHAYTEAMERAFGANVDYAQIVKIFKDQSIGAEVIGMDKRAFTGRPNMGLASTSHVERLNGTTRLHMRRLTRLTYAFSKKKENFEAAVALHFAYYNFVKRHITLRATPAMAAGIERDFWTVGDLVDATA